MKNAILTLLLIIPIMPFVRAHAASSPSSKEVTIGVLDVFVPGGFSSTTDATVIVSGMFPNTCYAWSRAEVKNTTPVFHEVTAIADVSQHVMCAMHMVPFQKDVDLGRLQSGQHTLRFLNSDGTYFDQSITVE